jgi:arabinofuranosyltransferase
LNYALAAAFFGAVVHGRMGEPTRRNVGAACLLASLAFVTRQDTILLYLPALAYLVVAATRGLRGKVVVPLLLGLGPAILWEAFSIVYYGFPFPNSAYAKLGSGIAALDLASQGLRYYANSLAWDPLTLTVTVAGVVWAATRSAWQQRAGALGVVLYLLYVVRIGGDFMSGRFFALPFLVALILIASVSLRRTGWGVVAGIALASLLLPAAPLKTTRAYESLGIDDHGIADERGYYFKASGLLFYDGEGEFPDHPGTRTGKELRGAPNPGAVVRMVGYFGYAAGPEKIVVDPFGIADPLLARLPVADTENWRIGHFERDLPAGYVESVLTGASGIEHPDLRRFHDKIRLIVTGPLFSAERLTAIAAINTGRYDPWVEAYLREP